MLSPAFFTVVINNYLPEPHASLLNGILFGIDLKTTKQFYQELKIVGLLHMVVLSGINITFLSSIIASITGFLGKRTSLLLTILSIILFISFVGFQAPIVRAGIMGCLTSVSILTGRKNTVLYSLFLSLIFILAIFPKWLTAVSLQLSYGATLGIVLFGKTTLKNPIWQNLKISLAAQLFTTPIIFIYFKQISLISPIANLLVAPVVPVLMVFGFLAAILGKLHFLFGLLPAYVCYGLLSYAVWIIKELSKIPYIFFQIK